MAEKECPCWIVTKIQLSVIDYERLVTDILADRQVINDRGRCYA